MEYKSVFDIIGPVMIGPSSSHTAGAVRIGYIGRQIFGIKPSKVEINLYGSFAKTYQGHGSDLAFVAGILGFNTDDPRLIDSFQIAKDEGIEIVFTTNEEVTRHPNTAKLVFSKDGQTTSVTGVSLGGGKVNITGIDEFEVNFTGENPAFIVLHKDCYGVIYSVSKVLKDHCINISHMEVFRKNKSDMAIMTIETDENIGEDVLDEIKAEPNIYKTIGMDL